MFRSTFREFEEDPFFSGHRERMRAFDMLRNFHHPLDFGPSALDGPNREEGRDRRARQQRSDIRDIAPMDMFGGMFRDMHSMFERMERNFETMANDPNAYSYSSSTVMSYSNDGKGDPKYYKASKSTKQAPGGVKETQCFVQDSDTGIHKMAIGHHLGDRAHVMERSLNRRTNEEHRHDNYHNMDENDADAFHHEWQQRTQPNMSSLGQGSSRSVPDVRQRHHRQLPRRALDSRAAGRAGDSHRDVRGNGDRARERRVRLDSRPTNKHSPRGGL